MLDVSLRQAFPDDQAVIRDMIRAARLDPTGLHWSHFWIAEHDGEVVGIGQVRPYPNCRELGSLVVRADYRGRGVGAQIVQTLLEQEKGTVYLECELHNEAFYNRFGFRRIPRLQAPMPLRLKLIAALGLRLFGIQVIGMKRENEQSA